MYEVELKVRADHDAVRDRLDALGAESLSTVTQVDTYYDAPDRAFAETDEALRVRVETVQDAGAGENGSPTAPGGSTRTVLTYKGPLVDDASKTRREVETRVADEESIRSILEGLGYEAVPTVRKERERYRLAGVTVTLDSVAGLGEFVEVELDATEESDDAVAAARDRASDVLDDLGLDASEQIRTSYLGLYLEDADA